MYIISNPTINRISSESAFLRMFSWDSGESTDDFSILWGFSI